MSTLPVLDPSGPLERRNQALKQAMPNKLNTANPTHTIKSCKLM